MREVWKAMDENGIVRDKSMSALIFKSWIAVVQRICSYCIVPSPMHVQPGVQAFGKGELEIAVLVSFPSSNLPNKTQYAKQRLEDTYTEFDERRHPISAPFPDHSWSCYRTRVTPDTFHLRLRRSESPLPSPWWQRYWEEHATLWGTREFEIRVITEM